MRGLVKAAVLLAPALASAFVVPDVEDVKDLDDDRPIADHSFALLAVPIPSDHGSGDERSDAVLGLRLDVLPSEQACGYGNITLDGHVLPQTITGDTSDGQGSISTERRNVVVASWSFHCIKVNGQPDSQFLKFKIDFVDGAPMEEEVGFSALFKQTGNTEILRVTNDLSTPDKIAANPNPEGLLPSDEGANYDVQNDMHELEWLYAQLHELHLQIEEKHEAIAAHASVHFEEDIKDCDSLKCVVATVVQKVKHTANKVYGKIAGDDVFDEEFGHFPKLPHRKPHWPKIPFHHGKGKHGNHTCGHPKHGKGNHTHPPHHKRPHWLPICRLPHHGPPHHKHPHPHPPPHHGPPHGKPPGDRPHHPPPPPPHSDQGRFEEEFEDDRPHGLSREDVPPSPHEDRPSRPDDIHPPGPPHGGGPPGPPRGRNGLGKFLHVLKFVVVGFLCALLLLALHRRSCTPKRRADRKARREERHRRRAYRRAVHKHGISRLLACISGHQSNGESSDDYEEKRRALLSESVFEDALSTTMTEEITQLQNAASVVDDMVSAEEGRSRSLPIPIPASQTSPSMRDYEIGSQVGDGEELPAYEDNDGSEMSSMVADGFRYTPGSSDYSPANSDGGSVSDILGPDVKT